MYLVNKPKNTFPQKCRNILDILLERKTNIEKKHSLKSIPPNSLSSILIHNHVLDLPLLRTILDSFLLFPVGLFTWFLGAQSRFQ